MSHNMLIRSYLLFYLSLHICSVPFFSCHTRLLMKMAKWIMSNCIPIHIENAICHQRRKTRLVSAYHHCDCNLPGFLQVSLSKKFKMVLLASSGELSVHFCPFQTDDRFLTTSSNETNLFPANDFHWKTFQACSFPNVWLWFLHHNAEGNVLYHNIYIPEGMALSCWVWGSIIL